MALALIPAARKIFVGGCPMTQILIAHSDRLLLGYELAIKRPLRRQYERKNKKASRAAMLNSFDTLETGCTIVG
jgi:hypothetical protein